MGSTTRSRRWRALGVLAAGALLWLGHAPAHAQDDDDDAARAAVLSPDAQRGQTLFRSTCGFCHGADAGGAQGPALTSSPLFDPKDHGRALAAFLKVGRPSLGMPSFESLTPDQIGAIRAFVASRRAAGPAPPAFDPQRILVGDPAAGRAYFEGAGHCAHCHSVSGDLSHIGARFNPLVLQGRIVNPRVVGVADESARERAAARITVTVRTPAGAAVSGTLVQANDFFVTLIDAQGVRRTFDRDNERPQVQIHDPAEAHRQQMLQWRDQDLWNVTAYLASLK